MEDVLGRLERSNETYAFTLIRHSDESGISGVGRVLDGIIFHTGQVVVCWRSDVNNNEFSSITTYPSWEAFEHIHIAPHPDEQTEIRGVDVDFSDLAQ